MAHKVPLNKRLGAAVCLAVFAMSLMSPRPVYARNIFQNIGRALRRTVTFVVRLPDKATHWMGPVLGPIAANILTANLAQSSKFGKVFVNAQKADRVIADIDEQRQMLSDLKGAYRNEADNLDATAAELHQARQDLADELTAGNISFDDYMEQAVAIEKLAQSYENVADTFRSKADTIDEGTIIGLVTKNAGNVLIGRVKDAVVFEVNTEISKFIRTDVINRLVGKDVDSSGLLIDLLVDSDVREFLGSTAGQGLDEAAFRDRLRDRIKEILRESRTDLRDNWREKIRDVMRQLAEQGAAEKETLPAAPTTGTVREAAVDEHGCRTGYSWDLQIGKCVQENCNDVTDAHWSYVKDCVCGSSGSVAENPEDPNKECSYSANYQSCPGCVYACVHPDEDCPLEGIGGY